VEEAWLALRLDPVPLDNDRSRVDTSPTKRARNKIFTDSPRATTTSQTLDGDDDQSSTDDGQSYADDDRSAVDDDCSDRDWDSSSAYSSSDENDDIYLTDGDTEHVRDRVEDLEDGKLGEPISFSGDIACS